MEEAPPAPLMSAASEDAYREALSLFLESPPAATEFDDLLGNDELLTQLIDDEEAKPEPLDAPVMTATTDSLLLATPPLEIDFPVKTQSPAFAVPTLPMMVQPKEEPINDDSSIHQPKAKSRKGRPSKKAVQAEQTEFKTEEEIANLSPEELKKHKRLMRNRKSAQLHRDRKKAYIEQLEGEVKDRDEKISNLELRVSQLEKYSHTLEAETARLKALLNTQGTSLNIPAVKNTVLGEGFTTSESGDSSDSDGTLTPPPSGTTSAHSPLSVSITSELDRRPRKIPRLASSAMLTAFVLLALFRLPLLSQHMPSSPIAHTTPTHSTEDPSAWPASSTGGRVLLSWDDDDDEGENDTETLEGQDEPPSFALVRRNGFAERGRDLRLPSHPSPVRSTLLPSFNPTDKQRRNMSYFVCPHTLKYMGESTDDGISLKGPRDQPRPFMRPLNKTAKEKKRSLRSHESKPKRQKTRMDSSAGSSPDEQVPTWSSDTTKVITQMLLANASEEQSATGNALVPINSQPLRLTPEQEDSKEEANPYLMLLVPSSSLVSNSDMPFPEKAGNHWVEIGCQLLSARFINDVQFSIGDEEAR